jgi:hypothetical protein
VRAGESPRQPPKRRACSAGAFGYVSSGKCHARWPAGRHASRCEFACRSRLSRTQQNHTRGNLLIPPRSVTESPSSAARAGGRPWPPRTGEGLPALTLQAHTLDATAARIVPHAAGRPRCDLLAQRDGRPTHSRASGAVQVQPRADASQHRWQDPADGGREPESSHNPYSGCTLRGRAPASW